MSKREGIISRIARKNSRLSNDVYKKMIKDSKLISKNTSQRDFKEAYHSPHTPDYIRAMLLSSLYNKNQNFLPVFKNLSQQKTIQSAKEVFLVIDRVNDKKSFILSVWDQNDFKTKSISPSNLMKSEIYAWNPPANTNMLLTRALLSGNAQSQKATYFFKDINAAIYAAADMIITNVKANDPFLLYLDESERPSKEEILRTLSKELGDFADTQAIFYRDLTHMKGEFNKLFPILNRMGIDTRVVERKIDELRDNVHTFISSPYDDIPEEIEAMYDSFSSINDTIDAILDLALQVESLDITDPRIYTIARLEILPTFTDYSLKKVEKHSKAVDGSVTGLITELLEGFNRRK